MAFYAKVVQTSNVTMQTPFKRHNAHVSKYWTVIFSDLILRRRKTNFHRLNGHIFWTEQAGYWYSMHGLRKILDNQDTPCIYPV
jgi:hypothetical protein